MPITLAMSMAEKRLEIRGWIFDNCNAYLNTMGRKILISGGSGVAVGVGDSVGEGVSEGVIVGGTVMVGVGVRVGVQDDHVGVNVAACVDKVVNIIFYKILNFEV